METSLPTSTHERVINPFTDWGFKHVFGREENKELLMGFLNQLLKPDVPIRDIQYLNTEITPDDPELRRCLFDVLCIDEEGDYYLVEMQKARIATSSHNLSITYAVWSTIWGNTTRNGTTIRLNGYMPSA